MLTLLALTILITHLLIAMELIFAARHLINLRQVPPLAPQQLPSLTIIVAARNEEKQMETALTTI